jgi:intein/homing endonuclease
MVSQVGRPKRHTTSGTIPPRKQQIEEIMRCGRDPSYFISKYIKISHPLKGTLPFETYDFQDRCLKAFQENRFVITNKSRQLGLSTLSAAYSLWMALFQKEKNILCIATRLEVAKNFVRKVDGMLNSLPPWLVLPQIAMRSVKHIQFSNGSKIQAVPTGQDAGRSEALSLLILDEAAHIENVDDLWLGLRPTLSCLVGNTKVFTDKGIFDIEEFHQKRRVGEYFPLSGLRVYGKSGIEKVSHGYVSPDSETLQFTTRHGYSVETTLKHPLWCLAKTLGGKMKKASEIAIGDFLRIQKNMGSFGPEEIHGDLAYILGGYIAEGNSNKVKGKVYGIQITNTDDDFRQVFLEKSSRFFSGKSFVVKPSSPHKLFLYSKGGAEVFSSLGIDLFAKCDKKTTPKIIWKATKDVHCRYLSGLFDGDGSVGPRGVVLNSTSKTLIQETQILLLNLGFHSNIHFIDAKKVMERERRTGRLLPQGKPVQSLRDSWQLQIPRSQFANFASEIGFRITRKQQTLQKLAKKYQQNDVKTNLIPVEFIQDELTGLLKRSGKTDKWFRDRGIRLDKWKSLPGPSGGRMVSADWLRRLRNLCQENRVEETQEEQRVFDEVSSGDFFWDPVVSIEAKHQQRTYDFTVPGTHTFVQNGILGSNTGGSAILISSPSGVGTLFHKIWVGARTGEDGKQQPNPGQGSNEFYRIELPWWVHPEHNQEWFDKEKAEILPAKGERGVGMELLCSFISSGDTFLNGEIVQELESGCQTPIDYGGPAGKVWIWKQVVSGHKYIIAADVARGDADDFSTFQVIDTTVDEQVAEFQGKVPPDQLADLMIEFGLRFNKALLCPELNSYGLMTSTALKKSGYSNLYYEKYSHNVYGIVPTSAEVQDDYPGITTGVKNREEMLAKLEQTLRNKKIRIYSTRMVGASGEIKTFIWKNNRAQAMKGYNDDLIMALAFANALYEAAGTTTHDSSELTKNMIAGMSRRSVTFLGQERNQTVNSPVQRAASVMDNPIIPTSMEVKIRGGGNRAIDMNDPFFAQFSWLLRDK